MTGARLLEWLDREDRRRRGARGGLAGLPPIILAVGAGAVLAGEVARRCGAFGVSDFDPVGASQLWLAATLAATVVVVLGAPFRMFWRHDSAFLSTLPIEGTALLYVGVVRAVRAAAYATIPLAAGAIAFGPLVAWEMAARHLALLGVAFAGGAALGPAAAVLAGTTVASDRAVQLIESVAGAEIGVPKTTWLGVLPGVAAATIAGLLLAGARWIAGDDATAIGPAPIALGASAAACALALVGSINLARKWMVAAVREVAALDKVRLAHIERVGPSPIERAWRDVVVPKAGRVVFTKDASLQRRRYPAPYFVTVIGVLVLWIVAATRPDTTVTWFGAVIGALAAYAVVMARRTALPPVEHPRLMATLPVAPSAVAAAKHRALWLRVVMTVVIGGVPVAARAADPLPMAIAVAAVAIGTIVIGTRRAT